MVEKLSIEEAAILAERYQKQILRIRLSQKAMYEADVREVKLKAKAGFAKKLLSVGAEVSLISKVTGFSEEEIHQLAHK